MSNEFNQEKIEEEKKNPIIYILALFLIIIVALMAIPFYGIKADPSPDFKKIPTLSSLNFKHSLIFNEDESHRITNINDFSKFINPSDPLIRNTAVKISIESCNDKGRICNAKALYYFVRDNIKYINDPKDIEYIETLQETLSVSAGDCESGTLLLASLQEAIGIDTQLVFIPGHVLIRINLPEARKSYKLEDDWIYLDWTCKQCNFGEIPYQDIINEKIYLEIP